MGLKPRTKVSHNQIERLEGPYAKRKKKVYMTDENARKGAPLTYIFPRLD